MWEGCITAHEAHGTHKYYLSRVEAAVRACGACMRCVHAHASSEARCAHMRGVISSGLMLREVSFEIIDFRLEQSCPGATHTCIHHMGWGHTV